MPVSLELGRKVELCAPGRKPCYQRQDVRRMPMERYAATAVLLVLLASHASAREGQNTAPFDQPLQAMTVHAGKKEVRCYTFAHVMVKEIDAGEIGDEQISLLPIASPADRPPCQAKNAANEHVVPSESWSGYFLGVKGDYVFLSAEDGVNGGLGFSVYRGADLTSLFQDSAKFERDHIRFKSIADEAARLRMRYTRVYTGKCSVITEGAACWARIAGETHLPPAPPDCAAGYLRAKQDLATARCEIAHHKNAGCIKQEIDRMQADDASPSVIGYDAEAVIEAPQTSIQPIVGPVACWPSD
jgi:hypothetical protein